MFINNQSSVTVEYFSDYAHCADITIPLLCKGAIALSGGSTYREMFCRWSCLSPDISSASFFPVDERLVPFDSPESNWGAAYRLFLKPLGKEPDKLHAADSVSHYQTLLFSHFGTPVPVFDVIFLGVGDDGHTAGLFPGAPYLNDNESIVLETTSPQPPVARITLGPRVLIAAKKVVVIIAGENKKEIVKRIFNLDIKMPIMRILSQRAHSILYIEKSLLRFGNNPERGTING